jgi:predicted ATPase
MPSLKLFVVTGGPGAGKTALIEGLAQQGFAVAPEAGRRVILDEQAKGGAALPWVDPLAFARAMLAHDIDSYTRLSATAGPVFCDRGIPDVIGYLRLEGLKVPETIWHAARTHRYNARVFICPPWRAIYATDSERRQTPEVAERTYEAMVAVYTELGYTLAEVPRAPVDARVRFMKDAVAD